MSPDSLLQIEHLWVERTSDIQASFYSWRNDTHEIEITLGASFELLRIHFNTDRALRGCNSRRSR